MCDHQVNLERLTWKCRDGVEKPAVPDGEKRVWLGKDDVEVKDELDQWIERRTSDD